MLEFAAICDAVASTASKTEKTERLAAYLRRLEPADLAAAARFLTGNPLAASDDRKLAIGGRTILNAAQRLWNWEGGELSTAYRGTGDLGEALARVRREPREPTLFAERLTPASFAVLLDGVAAYAGKSAGKRREELCERVLRACRSEREVAYVVKIVTGELRIGLKEGLVLDAIAKAFERAPGDIRRAAMAAGDVGAVALAARAGNLDELEVRFGAPVGFMLASPVAYGSAYRELATGSWIVEDKYDGIRVQAHVRGSRVQLFSRTFSDAARAFPEIAAALRGGTSDAIYDGEIVARRDGGALPFRYLQPRLQRVDPGPELLREVPAAFVAFDILATGGRFLLDAPLAERRALLAERLVTSDEVRLAPWQALETGNAPERVGELFEAARLRGNEGLMFKRSDAPYAPGRRGKWWLKLKRELSTLDCVVIAVEWGHGKRKGVLSDYTFAVRRSQDDGELLALGKAYSGLTDAEIAEQTQWFLAHQIGTVGHAIAVEPSRVVEIAFDVIAPSTLHPSGFALRFPRIVRLRPDKRPQEIDTLADVERIYREMLEREGVAR